MKVIDFPKEEKIEADEILENSKGKFQEVLVCGYDEDGGLYMVYNTDDPDLLYTMVSRVRKKILKIGYDEA